MVSGKETHTQRQQNKGDDRGLQETAEGAPPYIGALRVSYVYTVLYTIYCILPMPFGHRSSIYMYLYVHILIHSFDVVKLLDYLLDITAWLELEAQAFIYTRINIC